MSKSRTSRDLANIESYVTDSGETRYRVRIRVHGQRFSRSFAELAEAQSWRDRQKIERRERRQGEVTRPVSRRNPMTLTALVRDLYWPNYARPRLEQRTRQNYYGSYRRWVAPSPLGAKIADEVDAEDILEWQEWCRDRGAGEAAIRTAQKVVSGAFGWAAKRPRRTGIKANPVATAEWPAESRQHEPYVVEHIVVERIRQRILHLDGNQVARLRDALLLSLMAQTGMRPSEARAIELGFVDEDAIEIPARISKNGKRRHVPLWQPLREDISAYADVVGLRLGDAIAGQLTGEPMSFSGWENWRERAYQPARNAVAAELRDDRLAGARAYDLCRHSYAAQQIAALMPLADLAAVMGHSPEVLSRHYARPLARRLGQRTPIDPEAEVRKARAAVERELGGKMSPSDHLLRL